MSGSVSNVSWKSNFESYVSKTGVKKHFYLEMAVSLGGSRRRGMAEHSLGAGQRRH